MQALRDGGWRIAVETNGSVRNLAFKAADLLTISPKRGAPVVLDDGPAALELKVVLPGDAVQPWADGEVLALAQQLAPCLLYVQPQDPLMGAGLESVLHTTLPHAVPTEARAEYRANVARCFTFVRRHPNFGLSVQVHKYLALP
jgi:organic radical activating enzyme